MNLNQLEYFKELINVREFSGAAVKLGISQPALTLQIQKLEEELGFLLIDRNRRPIRLTSEGERFYHKSVEILKMVDDLKDISIELSEEIRGLLKVGIIPTLAPYLVPLIVKDLKKHYPGLILEIAELKTTEIIRQLKSGHLDCGLLATPIDAAGIVFDPLFYENFYIYISETHPLSGQETIDPGSLDDEEIWFLEEGNCFSNQVGTICPIGDKNRGTQNLIYRTSSIESLRRIVENQSGATFIPELATINVEPSQEELIREISGETPSREISIARTKPAVKERQINALKEIILANIPRRMHTKGAGKVLDTKISVK